MVHAPPRENELNPSPTIIDSGSGKRKDKRQSKPFFPLPRRHFSPSLLERCSGMACGTAGTFLSRFKLHQTCRYSW